MEKFSSNGFEIGFQKIENCGDENVLFIHGNLASKEWWYPCIENMSAQPGGGVVLAADWRGYGDSTGLNEYTEINFETFAADFVALVKSENLRQVNLVGHSTGGLIAMLALQQEPELFKSLTLLDSVGAQGLILDLPREQVLSHFDKMSEDKDYARIVLASTMKDCDIESENFNKLFEITWKCDKVMFRGVPAALTDGLDYTESFSKIDKPTLVLHGSNDVVLKLSMSESLRDLIPGAVLRVMDGQGHSMNMENPSKLASELSNFWSSL